VEKRLSFNGRANKNATTPVNRMLNYAYIFENLGEAREAA
jgi:hypothetical protein